MPLIIELYKGNEIGRLVIDRNNLIIQFLPSNNSEIHRSFAANKRSQFNRDFSFYLEKISHLLAKHTDSIDDPRHMITEHMCEADKAGYHVHYQFKENITLEIIKQVLACMPYSVWLKYISQDCYNSILPIVTNYFGDLTNSESKAIEAFYESEKERQLAVKNRQLKAESDKKEEKGDKNEDPNQSGDISFFLAIQLASTMMLHSMLSSNVQQAPVAIFSGSPDSFPRTPDDSTDFSPDIQPAPLPPSPTPDSPRDVHKRTFTPSATESKDAARRVKLEAIQAKFREQKFDLHSGGTKIIETKDNATVIHQFPSSIAELFQDLTNILKKPITEKIYNEFIRKIHSQLSEKTKPTSGFFGLGARDIKTANFNKSILEFIKEDLESINVRQQAMATSIASTGGR